MSSVLLATAYFPPVIYFSEIINAKTVILEKEENFQKQTFRNRCVILGANGPLNLTIPVKHDAPKIRISDLLISYHSNWQTIHLRAIESAYRNSPFYEYYIDDFLSFFNKNYHSLLDFNTAILKTCINLLKIRSDIEYSASFTPLENPNDLRISISPKKELTQFIFPEYHQVFIDKFGFISNLSVLDLIFNLGPDSLEYLKNIKKMDRC